MGRARDPPVSARGRDPGHVADRADGNTRIRSPLAFYTIGLCLAMPAGVQNCGPCLVTACSPALVGPGDLPESGAAAAEMVLIVGLVVGRLLFLLLVLLDGLLGPLGGFGDLIGWQNQPPPAVHVRRHLQLLAGGPQTDRHAE
jgi:hypothetical protein